MAASVPLIILTFQLSEHPLVTMCSDKWLPISIPSHTYLVVFGSSLLLLLELFVHHGSRGHQPIAPTMHLAGWWQCSSRPSPASPSYWMVSQGDCADHSNTVQCPEWTRCCWGWRWCLHVGRENEKPGNIDCVHDNLQNHTMFLLNNQLIS